MTSHPLVPEKRTDRNGRTQTRWVRQRGASPAPLPTLPPAPTAPERRTIPTPAQLERKERHPAVIDKLEFDDAVFDALGLREVETYLVYSEAELYDLLSVVSPEDAFMFLSRDIQTSDGRRTTTGGEAAWLLRTRGLSKRVVDRSALMEQAMEREISTFDVLALYTRTGAFERYDPTIYLDAAKLANTDEFRYDDQYWRSILSGTVKASDVEEYGLHDASLKARHLHRWFAELGQGAEWFDLAGLRAASDVVDWDFDLLPKGMDLIREQGQEFFMGLQHPKSAIRMQRFHVRKTPEGRRALIEYVEAGGEALADLPPAEVPALLDAGVAPATAARMIEAGMTPEQAASAVRNAIEPGLSSGWL